MGFTEIADRVWVARYPWFDVNVTAIGGRNGLAVVDTHSSSEAARDVIDDLRSLGAGDVRAIVNTHDHVDHVLGNHAFRQAYADVPIHAHEEAAAATPRSVRAAVDEAGDEDDPRWIGLRRTPVVAADHTFSRAAVLDLGDRMIELLHPGRGHTAGDAVVRVPDCDVLVAGDLIEESGPPDYGPDSFPMEWPLAVDLILDLTTADTVVVPGHGAPVDREFVEQQRGDLGIVAETIRDLAGRGVRPEDALDAAAWPFPPADLGHAVARGFAHLPRAQRRLPLV